MSNPNMTSLSEILALVASIAGKSDKAPAIAQALEDHAAKYPRTYNAVSRDDDLLGTFLQNLEEAVDARIERN